VVSGSTPGGFRDGSGKFSGVVLGNFRVGSCWFPSRLRVVSASAPGNFRVSYGSAPGNFRVGSGWFPYVTYDDRLFEGPF
jgi:hypothetical protein